MTLKKEMLRNLAASKDGREKLVSVMEDMIDAINDLQDNYTAHLANGAWHSAEDTTNTLAESNVTAIDSR